MPDTNQENPSEAMLTAADYKNAGNKLCALSKYDEAISYYSEAIIRSPDVPVYYSNRALCHSKLSQWPQAIQDCRKALDLDPNLVKAQFFLGQALAESGEFDEALKHLQTAHELSREQKLNFGDDIAYQVRLVKRRRWSKIEEDTTRIEDKLQNYLIGLIQRDKEEKLNDLKESYGNNSDIKTTESSVDEENRNQFDSCQPENNTTQPDKDESRDNSSGAEKLTEESIISECDSYIESLQVMLDNLRLQRKIRDVPDYLCGKISFEIMQDPVITPSGITYDRKDIEEHLRRVGHFDPITRQPLDANQLITNLAMKEVVDAYLKENEWALYY